MKIDLRFGNNRESHGMYKSPEHKVWRKMKERCYNEKAAQYARYGGRGIVVCDEWLNSFSAFFADVGPRPSANHSLERIDNNGNYTPANCRWADRSEQARNRCSSHLIEFNGKTQALAAWAAELGISQSTLLQRVGRLGWSIARALTTPPRQMSRPSR